MYGNRQQSPVSEIVPHSAGGDKDTSMTPSDETNTVMCKFLVEDDVSFLCASEEDVMEVEHLFVEPKSGTIIMDNILCVNPNKETQDFKTSQGGKEESEFEFPDGVLNGVDGEGDLHKTNGLPTMCDEYLLDAEFAGKFSDLNNGSCGGSCLGVMELEGLSSEWSGRITQTPLLSELPTSTIPVPETSSDPNAMLLDKIGIYDLHETFRSTFGSETSVSDEEWLKRRISFGLQDLVEFENVSSLMECENVSSLMECENVSSLMECGVQTNENKGNMLTCSSGSSGRMHQLYPDAQGSESTSFSRGMERENLSVGVELVTTSAEADFGDGQSLLLRQKRLRKPTRRYIEELPALKVPTTSSRDKVFPVKYQHQLRGFGARALVCRQDYLGGSGIQVPFGHRARKGRPKKSRYASGYYSDGMKEDKLPIVPSRNLSTETAVESQDDMSDDCVTTNKSAKGRMRRKHHRLWTLSEVMKLIDGVSQYGVGRWTEIKRSLFSSSAYRTSVDLKDKWRNLLRASCAQLRSKREVEGQKNSCRPIPQYVLQRVNELAIVYPYPRERKTNLSYASPVAAPVTSAPSTPISRTQSRGKVKS